jgi:hypothetical protein
MKNDLTTRAWQHDIGCPISITLLSTSDALLINRILEYFDSALEIGNVLYRYLIRIDWMEMQDL